MGFNRPNKEPSFAFEPEKDYPATLVSSTCHDLKLGFNRPNKVT
ncbi:uncharacterized protein G2W53_013744 [Senna tora]|uniref:Uncharacterized protein n=1 Tax=Senna tora TaxID=362788 RepID=A0A834WSB3_9FABA|nr:uncharacterized protein G2W53_013744 [Senna tora]